MASAISQFQRTFQGQSLERPSALFHRRLLNSDTITKREELDSLFANLESSCKEVANEAMETLDFLLTNGFTLLELLLDSLPDDVSASKKIALDHYSSKHFEVRQRAYIACSHLAKLNFKEGFTIAASIASEKLHSSDEETQQEGVRYFSILFDQFKPSVSEEDLETAINIASEMFLSHEEETRALAYVFFDKLIGSVKEEEALKMKEAILNACASTHYALPFDLCLKIVIHYSKCEDLISIPLQAAINACRSENPQMRKQAFLLFDSLLNWAPEYSITTVIQGILIESKRQDPSLQLLLCLEKLVNPHSSTLLQSAKKVIESNRQDEDLALLREALKNLSSCKSAFFQKRAQRLYKKIDKEGQQP